MPSAFGHDASFRQVVVRTFRRRLQFTSGHSTDDVALILYRGIAVRVCKLSVLDFPLSAFRSPQDVIDRN